jgi:ABC-type glycerol-3-phosphate transport system substrate-binding protein
MIFLIAALICLLLPLLSCSPQPKEHVTITYAAGNLPSDQQALVREVIVAFEKEFPLIHVEPKFEQFDGTVGAGRPGADVFAATADDLPTLNAREVIVDLTPMITIEKKLLDPFYPEVAAASKLDNRQMMMPVRYSTDLLFYNQDLLLKIGRENRMAVNLQDLDWEAIPKFAQPFVLKEGDRITRYALAPPRPLLLIQAWGANPFAWNEVTLKNELTRKALTYYDSLIREHHLAPGPDSPEWTVDAFQLFREQKVVFFVGDGSLLAEADKIKDFKWDIAPAPKGPKRMQPGMPQPGSMTPPAPVEVWPRYARFSVSGNCVWVNSAYFSQAWQFARFCSTEPAQRIFAKVRAGVPGIKVVAESTEFLRQPPGHVDVLLSSRAFARQDNTHSLVFFDPFCQQAFGSTTEQLLRGKLNVDEALEEMNGIGTLLMEQSKAKKK